MTMRIAFITSFISLAALFTILAIPSASIAQENAQVRTPEEILGEFDGNPSDEAILELFVNASEWDAAHQDVRYESQDALIELGADVLPPIFGKYLSSTDVRRRIALDDITRAVGHPAAKYLLPYLEDEDPDTRRHAAYLLGDTAFIGSDDDPLKLGPLDEDIPARDALLVALEAEEENRVIRSLLYGLSMIRDPETVDWFIPFVHSDMEEIRLAAVTALANIPYFHAVEILISKFDDDMGSVRQAAIIGLSSESMGAVAFDYVVRALTHGEFNSMRQLCALETMARYLENIYDDDSMGADNYRSSANSVCTALLTDPVYDEYWNVRGHAVAVLGYTKMPESDQLLLSLVATEEHAYVAGKIREALDAG